MGLSYRVREWVEEVVKSANRSDSKKKKVVYVAKVNNDGKIEISACSISLKKNGEYGKSRKYYSGFGIEKALHNPANYFTFDDMAIFTALRASIDVHSNLWHGSTFRVDDSELLERIVSTGNCYYKDIEGPALKIAEPINSSLNWKILEDGSQEVVCNFGLNDYTLLKLTSPWYFDPQGPAIGKIDVDMDPKKSHMMLNAPRIKPSEVEIVKKTLMTNEMPLPSSFEKVEYGRIEPQPCLTLKKLSLKRDYFDPIIEIGGASISFEYDGMSLDEGDDSDFITKYKNGTLIKYTRDVEAERSFTEELAEYGFASISSYYRLYTSGLYMDKSNFTMRLPDKHLEHRLPELEGLWSKFFSSTIHIMRDSGWEVKVKKNFPNNIVKPDAWYSSIDEPSGIEWFSYELGVYVNGAKVNLLPIILQALNDRTHAMHSAQELDNNSVWCFKMQDGSKLAIPSKRVEKIIAILKELYSYKDLDDDGKLRFERYEAVIMSDAYNLTTELDLKWLSSTEIVDLGKKLKDFKGIETVTIPDTVEADLREYQKTGVDWLQFLRKYNFSGILADDMGLGKTLQALAHISCTKRDGRKGAVLVVTPTSVVYNWRSEAAKFVPSLTVLVLHGMNRKEQFSEIDKYDIVITTYSLIVRDIEVLSKIEFDTVILDEAQYIKNDKAKVSKMVCKLSCNHRLCLTGTPVENHLSELWSQFNFLMPGFLGTSKTFRNDFRNPIEQGNDREKRALLAKKVKPFLLRRNKKEVISELPPKSEIVKNVELSQEERDIYETIRVSMEKKVREAIAKHGMGKSHITVLDALLKLRQICCDPRLLEFGKSKTIRSSKLDLLMEMVTEMIEEGRRILLFSQFVRMIEYIEERLNESRIEYLKLTGSTRNREEIIKEFQEGSTPLFLISLKAGGTGINLTGADTVIHYDPWWNPAVEEQATDRTYRIGQDKSVFVYKLVTVGTVEEKIMGMQDKKRDIASSIFDEQGGTKYTLSTDDITRLFE